MRKVIVSADLIIPIVYEVEVTEGGDIHQKAEDVFFSLASSELLKHANTEEVTILEDSFNVEDVIP